MCNHDIKSSADDYDMISFAQYRRRTKPRHKIMATFGVPAPPPLPPAPLEAASILEPLWAWAQWSLQNQLYENATFLAERVLAESACDASKLLLATCHYSAGAANRAAAVLQGCTAPQNRYLLALCCMRLGKLPEAQTALLGPSMPDTDASASLPNGAAGLYLMGMICLKMQQRPRAIKYLTRSLGLNPFLWSAYEALSQLGAPLPEGLVAPPMPSFGCDSVMPVPVNGAISEAGAGFAPVYPGGTCGAAQGSGAPGSAAAPATPMVTPGVRTPAQPSFTPAGSSGPGGVPSSAAASVGMPGSLSTPNLQTPSLFAPGSAPPSSAAPPSPGGPGNRRRPLPGGPPSSAAVSAVDDGSRLPVAAGGAAGRRGRALGGSGSSGVPVRRSTRLSATGPGGEAALAAAVVRGEMPPQSMVPRGPGSGSGDGVQEALLLLRQLASGYRALCLYKCQDAVLIFRGLAPRQYNTGWVLNQVGRAHFEMVQYTEALRAFEHAHLLEPHRLCGMEVHSTILWHLKREVALCHLAKKALDFERTSAYACCVVGNCFSLQKEHDTALKFFQRAIQLQPDFAYAYTLSGHEYSANDDFEKAMACYRSAIRIDERHYNAWYGLGNIYFRQEKFDFSEHHLKKALAINPCSSPLYCYLGMALHSNQKTPQALEMLSSAIQIDPKNPLARFQKAQVLLSTDQYELALSELKQLVEMAPKEGSVYFVLGKVYKKLGDQSKALQYLTRALDLSPKDAQQIKSAILNLEKEDNAEEEDEL